MTRLKRKVWVLALVTVAGLVLIWFIYLFPVFHGYVPHLMTVRGIIGEYIESTSGQFPTSIDDLQDHGLIRIVETTDGVQYFRRSIRFKDENSGDAGSWTRLYEFERIELAYGTALKDLKVRDGQVIHRKNDVQVLLIKGPYPFYLKSLYEDITYKFYCLMAQESELKVPK